MQRTAKNLEIRLPAPFSLSLSCSLFSFFSLFFLLVAQGNQDERKKNRKEKMLKFFSFSFFSSKQWRLLTFFGVFLQVFIFFRAWEKKMKTCKFNVKREFDRKKREYFYLFGNCNQLANAFSLSFSCFTQQRSNKMQTLHISCARYGRENVIRDACQNVSRLNFFFSFFLSIRGICIVFSCMRFSMCFDQE